jgi:hypothetical protein
VAIVLKRQLNEADKAHILELHGRKCFATGHVIPDGEPVQFDHIVAFSRDGVSELDNIAPMCAQHNKEKGALPLQDFRTKLRLQDFFQTGEKLTLKHLLKYMKEKGDLMSFAAPVSITQDNGSINVESAGRKYTQTVYLCPTTHWQYFYATLDVDVLDSDDDKDSQIGLQPRYLIFDRVFELYRHFQQHPVLQPSLGRIVDNHIRLFDGQHKVAALLWNGRRIFECKIYVDPEIRLLNQTNIDAHDRFSQARFFSSVMVMKLGSQFGADFENYKNLEDGKAKTEAGFMEYLSLRDNTLTKAQLNQRFRSYLYNSVLREQENKMSAFVSESNRSTADKPLTIDLLTKSLFSNFLYREPTEDNMTTEEHKRDDEMRNMVGLMNFIYELALAQWNPNAGENDEKQRKLNRMFRSKSMMAWTELLRDAVCGKLEIHDADDWVRPFYRPLTEAQLTQVKNVVLRLANWKIWSAPANEDIDRVLADNKSEVKDWFRKKGLTTGYLMGAPE